MPILIFTWQKIHYPIIFENALVDSGSAKNIFLNYIRYWDYHRQRFDNIGLLATGFFYSFLTFCLAVFLRYFNKKDSANGEALFFSFVIASTVLSWPFVFIPSWFDPGNFPEFFVSIMPGRFINLSIFICTSMLVATLYLYMRNSIRYNKYLAIMVGCTAAVVLIGLYVYKQVPILVAFLPAIIWVGLYINKRAVLYPNIYLQIKTGLSCITVFLVCLSPVILIDQLRSAKNNNFRQVEIPANIKGSILTTMENWTIQAETRVSSLTPEIDGYPYIGKTSGLLALNQYVSDLYGITIAATPPPNLSLHAGEIETRDYKNLWESRTCEEWESLASKYHFGLILVPADMQLHLRKIDNDPEWNKYYPGCQEELL
jgi:hypothetical protein